MSAITKLLGYGLTDRLFIFVATAYLIVFELEPEQQFKLAFPLCLLAGVTIAGLSYRPSSLRKVAEKVSSLKITNGGNNDA